VGQVGRSAARAWRSAITVGTALVLLVGAIVAVGAVGGDDHRAGATSDGFSSHLMGMWGPHALAVGSDGAIWVGGQGGESVVGRITTSGQASTFPVPGGSTRYGISAGPDGALWYTNYFDSSIGRITTDGDATTYSDTTGGGPFAITSGPDGALWFTEIGAHPVIGRITTAGVVTTFTDERLQWPESITSGPDGNLWFADYFGNTIGRITPAGDFTFFSDPAISSPGGMVVGPDDALWFTNLSGHSIARITTGGEVTSWYVGPSASNLGGVSVGPDGALWFVWGPASNRPMVGRITTDGEITVYPDSSDEDHDPTAIVTGPDGALWFANTGSGTVTRLDPTTQGFPLVAAILGPGGILDTGRAGGPTATDPIDTSLQNPAGGASEIIESTSPTQSLPSGYTTLPAEDTIASTSVSSTTPLVLRFQLDASLLAAGGVTADTVVVFRDGAAIGACDEPGAGVASPDPCVFSRTTLAGGDAEIGVYSTHASQWNFARASAVTPPPASGFVVSTTSLPAASLNHAYSTTLGATGGTPPYKWKRVGKTPPGLKLNANTGVISGTPKKKTGTFTFVVEAKYKTKVRGQPAVLHLASRTLSITVT
jgi:virginiamycin B lyase